MARTTYVAFDGISVMPRLSARRARKWRQRGAYVETTQTVAAHTVAGPQYWVRCRPGRGLWSLATYQMATWASARGHEIKRAQPGELGLHDRVS